MHKILSPKRTNSSTPGILTSQVLPPQITQIKCHLKVCPRQINNKQVCRLKVCPRQINNKQELLTFRKKHLYSRSRCMVQLGITAIILMSCVITFMSN